MLALDTDLGLVSQPSWQATKLPRRLIYRLFAKVYHRVGAEGDASIASRPKHEEWLTAKDHHEAANVKFSTHIESWPLKVSLHNHFLKDGNLSSLFLVFSSGASFHWGLCKGAFWGRRG